MTHVPDFDAELRECVETILGVRPPLPTTTPSSSSSSGSPSATSGSSRSRCRRVRRGRGLDRARPTSARATTPSSCSAPRRGRCTTRTRHSRTAGRSMAGWLLARLDLRLPIEEPYGGNASTGSVAALLSRRRPSSRSSASTRSSAVAGRGLVGDRYHDGRGTFSGPGRGYQLTLVEAEALDAVDLSWEQARRNVVTRGISLNALVGRRFRVGPAECVGRRLAEPCAHLEKLTRPGILRPLVHRAGLRADILSGGPIAVGDTSRRSTKARARPAARTAPASALPAPRRGRGARARDSRRARPRRIRRS